MKLYSLALLLMLSGSAFAQTEDCTFSSEGQLEVLKTVATRYPGGTTDTAKREITWLSDNGDKTVFSYGGCEDLGSLISITSRMTQPRSKSAVLAVAVALGERFWGKQTTGSNMELAVLKGSIQRNRLITEKREDATVFNIHNESYAEFYIEHKFKDGLDTVSVAWQGAF